VCGEVVHHMDVFGQESLYCSTECIDAKVAETNRVFF
jgi:hypothetical protein